MLADEQKALQAARQARDAEVQKLEDGYKALLGRVETTEKWSDNLWEEVVASCKALLQAQAGYAIFVFRCGNLEIIDARLGKWLECVCTDVEQKGFLPCHRYLGRLNAEGAEPVIEYFLGQECMIDATLPACT